MLHNKENLEGHGFDEITAEEQREIARKGGKASVEARRKKKKLKECLEMLLQQNVGKNEKGETVSGVEAMAIKAMQEAMRGDWKAWELVRDTSGQKPADKVMVAGIDQDVIDEVEAVVASIEDE